MKLERIELNHAGPFTAPVAIGPLDDGINLLSARNETGKTTILMGAARALFDRHNVTGEAIECLQPVGTSLAPDLSVVFRTAEGRFRIHKRFLQAPISELSEERDGEWHPVADGDAADSRVLDLIGGIRPGRGVSKAEHWGLLRYLWARQGEPVDWPAWDDKAGAGIRTGLAQVEIDPLIEHLRGQLQEAQAEQFTSTGRVARKSPLQTAQQLLENLEADLIEVRSGMEKAEENRQALQQLQQDWVASDRAKSETNERAETLTGQLKQVELLQKDLERFEEALERAKRRLGEINRDSRILDEAGNLLKNAREELAQGRNEVNRTRQAEKKARESLSICQEQSRRLRKKLDHGRQQEERSHELLELHRRKEILEGLRRNRSIVDRQNKVLEQLRRKRAALPGVTPGQVTRLEQEHRALRELTVRAESIGLQVALKPESDGTIRLARDGNEETRPLTKGRISTVTATRHLHLKLPGWGELDISSGAKEAIQLEKQIAENSLSLNQALKEIGVVSVEDARRCADQMKDLDRDIRSAESGLAQWLEKWDTPEALTTEVDRAAAEIERQIARLTITEEESSLSRAELKSQSARLHAAVDSDQTEWTALQETIEQAETRIERIRSEREEALKCAGEKKVRIAELESQVTTLKSLYPNGIEEAEETAQKAFVEAKAELGFARKQLPDDWEKLGNRHERALKSAVQAARSHQELEHKIRDLETLLSHTGSRGLFSRETELIEAIANAKEQSSRILSRGLAARFLVGLIDYRKRAAVRTVLKPLEDQLSTMFSEITGDHHRRVFLDENLQVSGIGRKRNESIAFTRLSQGAREQLLLALRAAVALELAKNGPQILILDDVLVNTDTTRQENVLDFLQRVARSVQILIVTCHPERYRGIGKNIGINPNP